MFLFFQNVFMYSKLLVHQAHVVYALEREHKKCEQQMEKLMLVNKARKKMIPMDPHGKALCVEGGHATKEPSTHHSQAWGWWLQIA